MTFTFATSLATTAMGIGRRVVLFALSRTPRRSAFAPESPPRIATAATFHFVFSACVGGDDVTCWTRGMKMVEKIGGTAQTKSGGGNRCPKQELNQCAGGNADAGGRERKGQ